MNVPQPIWNIPASSESNLSHCYRISLIQALMHTPRFANWIRANGDHEGENPPDRCVACILQQIAEEYSTSPFRPRHFAAAVTQFHHYMGWQHSQGRWDFEEDAQCDVVELLMFLWARFKEEGCAQ
jgi:uncharacterized UBP type Zn finger protein